MEYEPTDTSAIFAMLGMMMAFSGIIMVFFLICYWKIFVKAGKPGWAAIIPIYSAIVLLEIVGKPTWWIILMFLPLVNIVIAIMVVHELSLSFGQGVGMTLLLVFLPFIGLPVLAFGDAKYQGAQSVTPQPV